MTVMTVDSLHDAVDQIAPILRENGRENERQCRLADSSVDAMTEASLYRVWFPAAYGGMEADPVTGLQLFEAVSRIDSAAGWNLMLSGGAALFGSFFPEGLDDFYGRPNGTLAGALNPPGTAVAVEGGYLVTGHWPFVSGCGALDVRA